MSDASKAVFLSYASQDAEAARRICDALRAAGLEVWFDQSELRGGDSWDAKIRRQIKECALFVPVISANTNARAEGYFRLEWKLAVDRSHLLADDHPFLFPVVIDETTDATARVPDKFRDVQWMRLNVKDTPETLAARVGKLLGGEREAGRPRSAARGEGAASPKNSRWMRNLGMIMGLTLGLVYALRPLWAPPRGRDVHPATVTAAPAAPAQSEARQLAGKAKAMSLDKYNSTADDYAAAEGLLKRALQLEQNDAEIWAISSHFNTSMRTRGFDHSALRPEQARRDAERAIKLNPTSVTALYALGRTLRDSEPARAEQTFRKILAQNPDDAGALSQIAWIYDYAGRVDEAAQLYERVLVLDPANAPLTRYVEFLLFFHYGRFADAERCVRDSIAREPSANSLGGLAMLLLTAKGDPDEAVRVLASHPELTSQSPRAVWIAAMAQLARRAPAETLKVLDGLTDEYIQDNWFAGPKGYFAGRAHAMAGRTEAARVAWKAGLAVVDLRLKDAATSRQLHLMRGLLLAFLGRETEALREARTVAELTQGGDYDLFWPDSPVLIHAVLGRADDAIPMLGKFLNIDPKVNAGWRLTPALLRLDPIWDKIRDDPRFQKLATSDQPATSAASALKPDEKSVAVLAFANLSDDKANEYFSDGISEELLNVLAKVPGLRVTARTSSFHFKGKDTPVPEIARQLGVAYVIEGSVRKQGDKVRITAQLIKAADGFHVWSDTFTRDLKDIFAVQDEIAGLVARNLEAKLGAERRPEARVDARAFELYMQGRVAWNRRNAEGFDRAEALFREALAIAPDFARAHAALGDVWMIRAISEGKLGLYGQRSASVIPPIEAEVQRALELDPDSAEAHATLGFLRQLQHRPEEALRLLRRSVELNPNYATGHHWLAGILAYGSWFEESIAEYRRAVAVDPLSPRILDNFGGTLLTLGRWHEALTLFDRALILLPDEPQALAHKAIVLARLGRRDEARALAGRISKRDRLSFLLATGERAELETALTGATRSDRFNLLSVLGRPDEALNYLSSDDIVLEDTQDWFFDPKLVPFHHDPRFRKIITELEFDDYLTRALAWQAANPAENPEAKK